MPTETSALTSAGAAAESTLRLLLTPDETAAALGVGRSQLWRLHSAGRLPTPVRLGQRCPRWRADELRAWIAAGCPTREVWAGMKDELR